MKKRSPALNQIGEGHDILLIRHLLLLYIYNSAFFHSVILPHQIYKLRKRKYVLGKGKIKRGRVDRDGNICYWSNSDVRCFVSCLSVYDDIASILPLIFFFVGSGQFESSLYKKESIETILIPQFMSSSIFCGPVA
jgi:hypothetical protein